MFTGIITNQGKIKKWTPSPKGGLLVLETNTLYAGVKLGESMAINGCCLTVVATKEKMLSFDVSDETMRKTAFAEIKAGQRVNLERALLASDRLGGHFVLGHVDAVGSVRKVRQDPGSVVFEIGFSKAFRNLVIEKGSIAIDGISLTACDVKKQSLSVYVIPHTLKETNLGERKKGDSVNLEFDVLGKYILKGKN